MPYCGNTVPRSAASSMVEAVHPTETRPTRDAATVVRQPWLGSVTLAIGPLVIMLSLGQLQ